MKMAVGCFVSGRSDWRLRRRKRRRETAPESGKRTALWPHINNDQWKRPSTTFSIYLFKYSRYYGIYSVASAPVTSIVLEIIGEAGLLESVHIDIDAAALDIHSAIDS